MSSWLFKILPLSVVAGNGNHYVQLTHQPSPSSLFDIGSALSPKCELSEGITSYVTPLDMSLSTLSPIAVLAGILLLDANLTTQTSPLPL
jgi:hypothetical protein